MKIVAAAIRLDGEVYSVEQPGRHAAVILKIVQAGRKLIGEAQGFLTDTGEFVDRIEAGKIALAAGQVSELKWPPTLYSEDLW